MKRIWYPCGLKSMCGRAIATASFLLTRGVDRPSTFTSTSPSASNPAMNATRDQVTARRRRESLDRSPATVEDVAAEGKVADEVGEEDEQHLLDVVTAVEHESRRDRRQESRP